VFEEKGHRNDWVFTAAVKKSVPPPFIVRIGRSSLQAHPPVRRRTQSPGTASPPGRYEPPGYGQFYKGNHITTMSYDWWVGRVGHGGRDPSETRPSNIGLADFTPEWFHIALCPLH
jgi:hypothetical protein